MSFRRALEGIERRAASLLDQRPRCPGCGFPDLAEVQTIILSGGEEVCRCSACDRLLAEDGRPLGDYGRAVILELPLGAPPELPVGE